MQVQIPVSASADPNRMPHYLSNSPSHSHFFQVYIITPKSASNPSASPKCNAMQYQVAWHASSAKSQGIDSEDKITT